MAEAALPADELTHRILRLVAENEAPVGAGSVYFSLQGNGRPISAPTIGRRLRDLEVRGLLRKVSVEGRTITPLGEQVLAELERERRLQAAGEAVLGALRLGRQEDVLHLLEARRPIEREAARLAAERATDPDLQALAQVLSQQESQIEQGYLGIEEDIRFHETVARASGNPFLEALVSLLRHHGQYSYTVTRIREAAGHRRAVDHRTVYEAIEAHEPERAAASMDCHLARLIAEVRDYWSAARIKDAPRPGAPRRRRSRG